MNESYTTNPLTGNLIKVGGAVYKKLMKELSGSGNKPSGNKPSGSKPSGSKPLGSRTRGWKKASPKRGKERAVMKEKCGDKCFLSPKKNGYPICDKKTCKPDCRGIISAKVRAGQYKDDKVMTLAKKAQKKFCL